MDCRVGLPASLRHIPRVGFRRGRAAIAAAGTAIAVGFVLRRLAVPDADAALVVMGFDPDRARLIDALVFAFLAAAGARLVVSSPAGAWAGGLIAFGLLFGGVFRAETRSALAAHGASGRFDPVGWIETVATLAVVAALVVGAASLLAAELRRFIVLAGSDARALARSPVRSRRGLLRPITLVAALVLVALALPVFSDMVNFTPDMRMRQGAPAPPGLLDGGAAATAPANSEAGSAAGQAATRGSAASTSGPGRSSAGGLEIALDGPRSELSARAPWVASRPTGGGRLVRLEFPAPWTGGTSSTVEVPVYTPPGYDASPDRRYPVAYGAPFGPGPMQSLLDGYVTSGTTPPEIIVWVTETGGPYPDSECADSVDGRERMESFIVETIVPWVDAHYRTIATPDARTTFGLSQGGFCAPMLLLRHPDVFRQSISMSGYYAAGISSGQTVNAFRPFGGDAATEAAYSPVQLVRSLARPGAPADYLVLAGNPAEPFYGPQLTGFDAELSRLGIGHAVIDDPLGHAWLAFDRDFPAALRLVGLRQAALGVFGGPNDG